MIIVLLTFSFHQVQVVIDLTTSPSSKTRWTPTRLRRLLEISTDLGYEKNKKNQNFIRKIREKCTSDVELFPPEQFNGNDKQFENGMRVLEKNTVELEDSDSSCDKDEEESLLSPLTLTSALLSTKESLSFSDEHVPETPPFKKQKLLNTGSDDSSSSEEF